MRSKKSSSVNVLAVNTVNVRGKTRNFARRGVRTSGKQSDYKKAIVTIKAGQKIELGGVNYFEHNSVALTRSMQR